MDRSRLETAEDAYGRGEWAVAAREYLGATEGEVEGCGRAYHRAGNALLKLKRFGEAVPVYERALADEAYAEQTAVLVNLGTALSALGEHERAIDAFGRALEDREQPARYRPLQGIGGAYFELARYEEAAEAYRLAALDGSNPDPGKALNNLGLTFMALDRPADAVEAYRAAIDLPGYKGRGRSAANLGMAYTALEMHENAVVAYERARDEFGHELSARQQAAYQASLKAAGGPARIEGWRTGEMPPVVRPRYEFDDDADEESAFFTRTDEEMRAVDREARRLEREDRSHDRPRWVSVLVAVAIGVVVLGVLVGGYLAGIGYPTQQMTVNGLLEAHFDGDDVASYWVAVPAGDMDKAMASLPAARESYVVGAVERSARSSTVDVTITLEQGGVVNYRISLAREGVGWKVNGVTTSFDSLESGT